MYQTQYLHPKINQMLWGEINQSTHHHAPYPRRMVSEFLLNCNGNANEYNDILTYVCNVVEIEYLKGNLQNDDHLMNIVKNCYGASIPFVAYYRFMNTANFDANMRAKIENGYYQWRDLFAGASNELTNMNRMRQQMNQPYQGNGYGYGNQQYNQPHQPNPYGGFNASHFDPMYMANQLNNGEPINPNLIPRKPRDTGVTFSAMDKSSSLVVNGQVMNEQPAAKYAPRQTTHWDDDEVQYTPNNPVANHVEDAQIVESNEPIKWFGSEAILWDYLNQQNRLARELPDNLYPVYGSELELINGLLCKTVNGKRYVVWGSNPFTPSCPAFDDLKKASTIRLTDDYLPYFILKDEEEKIVMELKNHIIPGEPLPSELASRHGTVVSDDHRFECNQKVKDSLELSPEEHEEQMTKLLAKGLTEREAAQEISIVELEQLVATNEDDLPTTVVSNALGNYDNPEVVESVTWVENPVVAIGGSARVISVLRRIYECDTIEEFKEKVLFPLRDMGEIAVFDRLCTILDKCYNVMLPTLPVCDIEVDDVINCHQEVVDGYVTPRHLGKYYGREVSRMLKNMITVDGYIEEYEMENDKVVPLAEKVTTAYIGLTFNELHLTKSCGVKEWRQLLKDRDSLLYNLAEKLCKMSFSDVATYRHQIITKDGLAADIVQVRGDFPSIQIRFNHK